MAHRTKSFFDQDHRPKRPRQWQNHSNHFRPALGEFDPNVPTKNSPIPANTQAKSKLKAFHFVPDNDENVRPDIDVVGGHAREGNKEIRDGCAVEHEPSEKAEDAKSMAEKLASQPSESGSAAPQAPLVPPTRMLPPSTPGTRIPLEDLIGDSDQSLKPPPAPEQSPEDQIGWIPNSSSTLFTPNRKRKRAQSSSPSCDAASSQHAGPNPLPSAEKTTPEDPTTTLWKNYAINKDNDEQKSTDLSHLLFLTSPRPLETPNKVAALRRWASTGNDWPTSRTKRRRTDESRENDAWRDQTGAITGGKSRVAAMVERLQESLATKKLAQSATETTTTSEGPSSSSPLPETGAVDLTVTVVPSPLSSRVCSAKQPAQSLAPLAKLLGSQTPAQRQPIVHSQSRYPDTVAPAPLHLQSKAPLPAFKRPTITRTSSGSGRQYPKSQSPVTSRPAVSTVDADEFGEDFDLTLEDLDELVGKPVTLKTTPSHDHLPAESRSLSHDQTNAEQDTVIVLDDDDEFGGIDLDDEALVQVELNVTRDRMIHPRLQASTKQHITRFDDSEHASPASERTETDHGGFHRFKIKQIVDGQYINGRGRTCEEKVLLAENDNGTRKAVGITLRDSWADTTVCVGNLVHITYPPTAHASFSNGANMSQLRLGDEEESPFLIVHPDHMLSATTVADSFDCLRKAVLQDRIKATGETNKAMVYGKILHAIFQQALLANQWDSDFLLDLVRRTIDNHLEGLWELGMTDTILANEEVRAKMGEMEAWANVFVAPGPSTSATVDDKMGEKVWMAVSKLIAIEEHVWSPRYGLKGNIDATVQTTTVDKPDTPGRHLVTPFEVKTGRTSNSPAHKAQTALYTLLLSDRYDVNVEAGVLYYLESSAMSRIKPPLIELRQMIQQRNRLASFLYRAKHPDEPSDSVTPASQYMEESRLPQMLKNPFKCGRCYAQQSCFTYHGLVEGGSAESAGMIDDKKKDHSLIWQEAMGHLALRAKDQPRANKLRQWFAKWDRLLTFEESDVVKLKNELWTMSSAQRQKVGRCFGNLILTRDLSSTSTAVTSTTVDGIEGAGGKINRFAYSFSHGQRNGPSFAEGTQLNVGEPVVVSSEQGQWALANGYVISATRHDITVAVDRKLGNARQRLADFDPIRNQAFQGVMTVGMEGQSDESTPNAPTLYRLDKDEFSNGLANVRNNLVTLMSAHPIHTRLRDQIITGVRPSFVEQRTGTTLAPSQMGQMNEDQISAVNKVCSAEDYALILGMPGTGKTSTIAHIIGNLLAENKSILLTSFTHTAVDNILLKIREMAPPKSILRLGVPAKINAEVQKFCQLAATPRSGIEEIERVYMDSKIVATTCMGTNHAIFNRRAFDVCIVDEASQITLPISLGPLLHARKFVLVGDHYQLPPLVQNRKALDGGLDISLFRQLSEEHPESVATLGKQYRMCEDIMTLSNTLVYSGRLRCGNEAVANRILQLSHPHGLELYHGRALDSDLCPGMNNCWLHEVTRPERKVVFANVDGLGDAALETLTSGKNVTNPAEATLCAQAVLGLLAQGVPPAEIGVITLYRSQLALIRQVFKAAGINGAVEIDSADRFQGRDKECILLSMVRSNKLGIVGDLLKDYRRVNVALTRARSKLVILGSRDTLKHNELLAAFLKIVDDRQWSISLPKNADTCHAFEFSSQSTAGLMPPVGKHSPVKQNNSTSPVVKKTDATESPARSQLNVLLPSPSKANRMSPRRTQKERTPIKRINGKLGFKSDMVLEQIAMDFFEDLTGDDF